MEYGEGNDSDPYGSEYGRLDSQDQFKTKTGSIEEDPADRESQEKTLKRVASSAFVDGNLMVDKAATILREYGIEPD